MTGEPLAAAEEAVRVTASWSARSPDPGSSAGPRERLRGMVDAVNVTDTPPPGRHDPAGRGHARRRRGPRPVLQLTCRTETAWPSRLPARRPRLRHPAVLCLSGDPMEVGAPGPSGVSTSTPSPGPLPPTSPGPPPAAPRSPPGPLPGRRGRSPADPSGGDRLAARPTPAHLRPYPADLRRRPVRPPGCTACRPRPSRPVGHPRRRLPPASAAQLERFATLPGWSVPDAVLARIRTARDQRAEGIALAPRWSRPSHPPRRPRHPPHGLATSGVPEVAHAAGLLPRPVPPEPGRLPDLHDGDLLNASPSGVGGHDHVRVEGAGH